MMYKITRINACRLPGLTDMTAQEVLDKLNEQWIDSRYKLCLVPTVQPNPDVEFVSKTIYSNQKNYSL